MVGVIARSRWLYMNVVYKVLFENRYQSAEIARAAVDYFERRLPGAEVVRDGRRVVVAVLMPLQEA